MGARANTNSLRAAKDGVHVLERSRYFLRQRIVRGGILSFLLVYCLVTLFPFYILLVRSFVSTRDSAELWLWFPPPAPVSTEAQLGNLSVFYSMDIGRFKEHFDIEGYLPPRDTLSKIAEDHSIPLEDIQAYLAPLGRFNGWYILLVQGRIWGPLARTVLVTVMVAVCVNLLSILTAFGLAGLRRRDQMLVYNMYLLRMVIPPMMIIIPQFIIVQWLIALVPGTQSPGLPRYASQLGGMMMTLFAANALAIMVYTAAIGAIPRDIEDATYLDGATRLQYLLRVVFPLLKVHIATVVVMTLPWTWNLFLPPLIYLDSANTTLIPFIQDFAGTYSTNLQVTFAGIFVSILPLAVLYIIFRRFFIQGIMGGALKG